MFSPTDYILAAATAMPAADWIAIYSSGRRPEKLRNWLAREPRLEAVAKLISKRPS
jgi:hypothetical protein